MFKYMPIYIRDLTFFAKRALQLPSGTTKLGKLY